MNRCEDHGPSRGSSGKQNLFTPNAKRKESGREGWMNGWRQGCGDASDVRPFKDESGNQSRPQPDATSPVNLKASVRQPVFERLLHPVVLFPPTFFFHFHSFFFLFHSCMHSPRNFKLWTISVAKTFFSDVFLLQSNVNFCLLKVGRHLSKISL